MLKESEMKKKQTAASSQESASSSSQQPAGQISHPSTGYDLETAMESLEQEPDPELQD